MKTLTADELIDVANRLKTSSFGKDAPIAAIVGSPQDFQTIENEYCKYKSASPAGLYETLVGLRIYQHTSLPQGTMLTVAKTGHVRVLLEELDRAQAKGLPWTSGAEAAKKKIALLDPNIIHKKKPNAYFAGEDTFCGLTSFDDPPFRASHRWDQTNCSECLKRRP